MTATVLVPLSPLLVCRLSSEPELSCDGDHECQHTAYPYGVAGFNGYLSVCSLHAPAAVHEAIADGLIVPQDDL